ncbi:ABC transporter ATP-binding protein [Bacillus sp. FJAT-45350]|uniref:ABC transporter ATP-binding protein n=1 Tax=Bacillus sp. FJAT-45350 TaxID=2011014 RepID=UPI000BB89522|nr:ABC transporter ATP-binding protein [Bacillus sp. FJAT-45350]
MNTSLVDIKGITKHYKNFSLGPIDFQVEKGTVVAVVGANGSGKSTFFRIMMNLLQVDEGSINIFGQNLVDNETEIKQKFGYVGDLLEPFSYLTIKELSSLIAYWYPTWNQQHYSLMLKRYNIDEAQKYGKCSKGTKKKVEFIFALCHDTKLLLLDEPSAGLDIMSQRKIKEDIMDYMEDGERSLVIATHNSEEVKQLCDYISILVEGKIIHTFEKDELHEKWARLWVSRITDKMRSHAHVLRIEEDPLQIVTNDLTVIEQELEQEGIEITHMNRLSLEEVIEYLIGQGE